MFNKNINLYFYAVVSSLLVLFFIYEATVFNKSFPEYNELLFSEGELIGEPNFSRYSTQFSLSNIDGKFLYHSKSGEMITVRNMTNAGLVARVGYTQRNDRKSVYELEIDGEKIRSYEEIRAAQKSDNKWIFLLIPFFVLNSIFLFRMARKH